MSDISTIAGRLSGADLELYDKASGGNVLTFLYANGSLPAFSAADALTASTDSNQAGGTAITKQFSRFTTVGTAGDSATLPAAKAGDWRIIKNAHATNSMDVFPATGETVNAGSANAAFAVAATKAALFFAAKDGHWDTILTA